MVRVKKTKKNLESIIAMVLKNRPFCDCSKKEKGLYSAYSLRVAETVVGIYEE